ncbi:unnamed protein product, partial [Effrenium voratum]
DPGYQDELCHWLDEAVSKTPKPSNWEADTVQEFAHNILGKRDMNKRLVLRKCYMDMCSLVHKWLLHNFSQEDMGVFVITGTPGIGKSVFLAYVAEGINIVIQLGKEWRSRQKNYDSVWKQAEGRSERYFMPVWSEEEEQMAYAMIGGSVRYLGKLLVAVAKNKTTLEEEAKQMIRDCVVKCTFEDLCQAADSGGADIDAQNNRSKMSRVLHIHSDAKFQTPNVKLIESEVCKSKEVELVCTALKTKDKK